MKLKIAIWIGLGLFALLSVTDWLLTYKILTAFPTAIEANPLAAKCLKHGGWTGLAVYKAATVLLFVAGVYMLLKRRPPVAAGIVSLGCVALLAVTLYSHHLMTNAQNDRDPSFNPTAWLFSESSREDDAPYVPHQYHPPLEHHSVTKEKGTHLASGTPTTKRPKAATH